MRIWTKATSQLAMYFKIALVLLMSMTASLHAGKFPSADEAVRQMFPKASFERETQLLRKAEKEASAKLANQKEVGALVTRYVVRNADAIIGYAYLDKHLVRTQPQILIVAVDADGVLVGIKVLAFREPMEYIAQDGWTQQFKGKTVGDEIRMKKNIDGITGATLTSRAVTQCARRILAVHQVLEKGKSNESD